MLGTVPATSGQAAFRFNDTTELPNGPFTYIVLAQFGSALSASDVQVTAVNTPPVAASDPAAGTYAVLAGQQLVVGVPGTLANDTDIDSPALSAAPTVALSMDGSFPSVRGGKVWLNANGSFTYLAPATTGPDSFVYVVNDVDTSRSSNVATVSIVVN